MWLRRRECPSGGNADTTRSSLPRQNRWSRDVTLQQRNSTKLRSLLREELSMFLAAHIDELVMTEADDVISRFGQGDMVSALAHVAKGVVQHRSTYGDAGAEEFKRALSIASSVEGFGGIATILDAIAQQSGIDVAIGLLNCYVATAGVL